MIALRTAACCAGVSLALAVGVTQAHGQTASPAPEGAESDCSWAESGTTMLIGTVEYRCLCALLTGPAGKKVLCRWYRADKLPQKAKPKPKPAPKKKAPKKPEIRVYPKPSVVA